MKIEVTVHKYDEHPDPKAINCALILVCPEPNNRPRIWASARFQYLGVPTFTPEGAWHWVQTGAPLHLPHLIKHEALWILPPDWTLDRLAHRVWAEE